MILPRTLIVDLSIGYGGSSSRVLGLLKAFRGEHMALAGLESGAVILEARKAGLPVFTLGTHKADPRILFRLTRLIRNQHFQVLDSQNIQSKFWASLATNLTNTALVSTINSWYENEHGNSSIRGKIYTKLELMTNRGLDLYITVSDKDRQSLLKSGIHNDSIELIYNAIEVDELTTPESPSWFREKFNIPPHSIVCIAVGRLVPVKGYDILVEAVKLAAHEIPHLVCLIVGDGDCRAPLEVQIQQLNLKDRVRLLGFQDRQTILSLLKSSDIFVMPSRYEGTPIALLEAAAMSRPIIASSKGGIPELVRHEVEALLVPSEDPSALAQGIIKLCKEPEYGSALGLRANERVTKEFNLNTQIAATRKALHKAWATHISKNTLNE